MERDERDNLIKLIRNESIKMERALRNGEKRKKFKQWLDKKRIVETPEEYWTRIERSVKG